jgi:hypothetical protein
MSQEDTCSPEPKGDPVNNEEACGMIEMMVKNVKKKGRVQHLPDSRL